MTRKGTPRPGNGGARVGAGRKPTAKPLKAIELDADTAGMLAEITKQWREAKNEPTMSQVSVIARLVYVEHEAIETRKWCDTINAIPISEPTDEESDDYFDAMHAAATVAM